MNWQGIAYFSKCRYCDKSVVRCTTRKSFFTCYVCRRKKITKKVPQGVASYVSLRVKFRDKDRMKNYQETTLVKCLTDEELQELICNLDLQKDVDRFRELAKKRLNLAED